MPKKKKRSRRTGNTSSRIRLLVRLLIVVAIAGVVLVKFLQTPRGRIVLLDRGFTDYYSQVQQDIELDLRASIRRLGLDKSLREEVILSSAVGGSHFQVRKWTVWCQDCNLTKINLGITKAARKASATVRSSRENHGGELLTLSIGSAKYTTHTIEVWRREAPEEELPVAAKGKLAIVVDDFGYSRSELVESFLSIDLPLTIAVIPSLRFSTNSLERAAQHGKQSILHVPMEANGQQSDISAIMTTMSDAEIVGLLTQYLDRYPGVVGINNHMGSTATQDRRAMDAVMTVLRSRDLFFLDSLTSGQTIADARARLAGVPTARNNLFLDADTEDPFVVRERLKRLIRIAQVEGAAIGIGHPRAWTLEAIGEMAGLLEGSGVELVFVSELME